MRFRNVLDGRLLVKVVNLWPLNKNANIRLAARVKVLHCWLMSKRHRDLSTTISMTRGP